jgi:hypothetical protein
MKPPAQYLVTIAGFLGSSKTERIVERRIAILLDEKSEIRNIASSTQAPARGAAPSTR